MQNEFESATHEAQKTRTEAGTMEAGSGAGAARDTMGQTAADLRDKFASQTGSVKEGIADIRNAVEQGARAMVEDKKAAGAEQLSGLARAINHTADELQNELPQAAGYVRQAAAKIDSVSTMLRERNVEELLHEANNFARTNAVTFFGMSLAAGFALARFLKSSGANSSSLRPRADFAQPHPENIRPEHTN